MNKPPVVINTEQETRGFFWFMTLVLIGITIFVIVSQPEMRQPLRMVPFVVLMSAHILLHWWLRRCVEDQRLLIAYVVVQGLLAAVLTLMTRAIGLAYGLSMGLIGEAVGVYGVTRRGLLVSAYYLLLSLGLYLWLTNGSQIVWWLLSTIPMLVFVVIYVELYSRQANANQRAQALLADLETANRQLTDYSAQVEDLTIAAERQRMARELHDTLSQGLAGLILQLEAADAHLSSGHTDKARQIVQQTMESARATLAGARRAIDNLRASDLPDCEAALEAEVEHFRQAIGLPCSLDIQLPAPLDPSLIAPLARITREGLSNIARHARASQVQVRLTPAAGGLELEILDDGVGFDPDAVPPGHYGLLGMRERAEQAGWTLKVRSQPGSGTHLTVHIPHP